ncbi:hypothetical protein KM043_010475 [Ampulex compressa]|nr:hypothetical protein KM043_010475 [Ampulex compressa]
MFFTFFTSDLSLHFNCPPIVSHRSSRGIRFYRSFARNTNAIIITVPVDSCRGSSRAVEVTLCFQFQTASSGEYRRSSIESTVSPKHGPEFDYRTPYRTRYNVPPATNHFLPLRTCLTAAGVTYNQRRFAIKSAAFRLDESELAFCESPSLPQEFSFRGMEKRKKIRRKNSTTAPSDLRSYRR